MKTLVQELEDLVLEKSTYSFGGSGSGSGSGSGTDGGDSATTTTSGPAATHGWEMVPVDLPDVPPPTVPTIPIPYPTVGTTATTTTVPSPMGVDGNPITITIPAGWVQP